MTLVDIISDFFASMTSGLTVYNEASLQFKLGEFIEKNLGKVGPYKVEFERNVLYPPVTKVSPQKGTSKGLFTKTEMDMFIYCDDPAYERFAIEVKYPRNDVAIGRMKNFTADIKFMEEVRKSLNISTYCLTLASHPRFYDSSYNNQYLSMGYSYPSLVKFYRTWDAKSFVTSAGGVKPCIVKSNKNKVVYPGMTLANDYDIIWNRLVDKNGNQIKQFDGGTHEDVFCYLI